MNAFLFQVVPTLTVTSDNRFPLFSRYNRETERKKADTMSGKGFIDRKRVAGSPAYLLRYALFASGLFLLISGIPYVTDTIEDISPDIDYFAFTSSEYRTVLFSDIPDTCQDRPGQVEYCHKYMFIITPAQTLRRTLEDIVKPVKSCISLISWNYIGLLAPVFTLRHETHAIHRRNQSVKQYAEDFIDCFLNRPHSTLQAFRIPMYSEPARSDSPSFLS